MGTLELPVAAATQAEQFWIVGKSFFKKDRFGAAIDAYTEAITLCPDVPIYWTDRARCYGNLNDWTEAEADCRKAIQLGHNSVKVHYILGFALLQKQKYTEAAKELEKAWDLRMEVGPNARQQIWDVLAKANYRQWKHSSSKRSEELQSLKEACKSALEEKHVFYISEAGGSLDEEVIALHLNQLEALEQVFSKAAEADTPSEVPDYLGCKIKFDILRDPVITPSGVTYERDVILEHLQKVGGFDPVTREPLISSQLVPNLAIKEAVQAFLDRNGWAYKTG